MPLQKSFKFGIVIAFALIPIVGLVASKLNTLSLKKDSTQKDAVERPAEQGSVGGGTANDIEERAMQDQKTVLPTLSQQTNPVSDLQITAEATNLSLIALNEKEVIQSHSELEWRSLLDDGTLLRELTASQTADGVILTGKMALPSETQIAVELLKVGSFGNTQVVASCRTWLDSNSFFQSKPFKINARALRSGSYRIQVVSQFDNDWQRRDILDQVGEGGRFLPKKVLTPDFAQFPDHTGHFREVKRVPTIKD